MVLGTIGCIGWAYLWATRVTSGLGKVEIALFAWFVLLPSAAAVFAVTRWSPSPFSDWWAVFLLTAIVAVCFVPWHPRQMFVWRLETIRSGASESEAREQMRGYLGALKTPPQTLRGGGILETISYRWNDTDGRYNSDIGEVILLNGRVVETRFDPD